MSGISNINPPASSQIYDLNPASAGSVDQSSNLQAQVKSYQDPFEQQMRERAQGGPTVSPAEQKAAQSFVAAIEHYSKMLISGTFLPASGTQNSSSA